MTYNFLLKPFFLKRKETELAIIEMFTPLHTHYCVQQAPYNGNHNHWNSISCRLGNCHLLNRSPYNEDLWLVDLYSVGILLAW